MNITGIKLSPNKRSSCHPGGCGILSLVGSLLLHLLALSAVFGYPELKAGRDRQLLAEIAAMPKCGGGPMATRAWPTVLLSMPPIESAGKARPNPSKSVQNILHQLSPSSFGLTPVTPADFDAAVTIFMLRDTNKDAKLDHWEFSPNDPNKKRRSVEADKNRDGYLSREEFVYGGLAEFGYR
jgi:hypothetical protein